MNTVPNPRPDNPPRPIDLHQASEHLATAAVNLARWQARDTGYVSAGNGALDELDATIKALNAARSTLLDEIRDGGAR